YTTAIITRYKDDNRIAIWDLYNEPECSKQVPVVLPLLKYIYNTALKVNPSQPLTIGIAKPLTNELGQYELSVSDIITFHSYAPLAEVTKNITEFRRLSKRPILCTEYLARPFGSTFFTHLNYFRENKVGAIHWGFVAGKSQTYYQWKSPENASMPRVWFHDMLYRNGTPYSQYEALLFKNLDEKENEVEQNNDQSE
ncbi:unnamed protein product, partial [Didymodactylos carnosus]